LIIAAALDSAAAGPKTATSDCLAEDRHQHEQRADGQQRSPGECWSRPHVGRKPLIRPAPGIRCTKNVVHQEVPPASEDEPGDYDEDLRSHLSLSFGTEPMSLKSKRAYASSSDE
jgi:hypothetical protein